MGKRWKKRCRSIICWNTTSSDSDVEYEEEKTKVTKEIQPVTANVMKKTPRLSGVDQLKQELDKISLTLEDEIVDLAAKIEGHKKWLMDTISKYLVPRDVSYHGVQEACNKNQLPLKDDSDESTKEIQKLDGIDENAARDAKAYRPFRPPLKRNSYIDFDKYVIKRGPAAAFEYHCLTTKPLVETYDSGPTQSGVRRNENIKRMEEIDDRGSGDKITYKPFKPPARRNDVIDFDKYLIKRGTAKASALFGLTAKPPIDGPIQSDGRGSGDAITYKPFKPPARRNDIIDFDRYLIKRGFLVKNELSTKSASGHPVLTTKPSGLEYNSKLFQSPTRRSNVIDFEKYLIKKGTSSPFALRTKIENDRKPVQPFITRDGVFDFDKYIIRRASATPQIYNELNTKSMTKTDDSCNKVFDKFKPVTRRSPVIDFSKYFIKTDDKYSRYDNNSNSSTEVITNKNDDNNNLPTDSFDHAFRT